MKRSALLLALLAAFGLAGCVKSTIDLNKVSGDLSLNPAIVMAAVKGNVTLADVIKPNDTLVVDPDKLIRFVFRQDSVISFGLGDFYESFPATELTKTFQLIDITLEDVTETLVVDPGNDIKIKEMAIVNGQLDYTVTSWCSFDNEVHLEFSTVTSGGTPLTTIINIPAGNTVTGTIDLSGYLADLTGDVANPYNRLPVTYSIYASGSPIFDPSDSLRVFISFAEPDFDFVKGYFGLNETVSENDTMETGMEDFFSMLTGSIYLSSPSITVNYENSFGIPLRVTAEGKGIKGSETKYLERAPVDLDHPVSEVTRDISSSFSIDKDNSQLPELISMLPELLIFGGSATSNPDGETAEDNIVFPDSRFIAGLEVEVPLEFRITNLQLSDTTDNFFKDEESGESLLDMLSRLRLDMFINNGFPLGGDITISLYDTISSTVLEQIGTDEFFYPADVDLNGRVIAPKERTSHIELTPDFLAAVPDATSVIFTFTLFTSDNGTTDVKIYSDYSIEFKAGVSLKANINLE